MRYLFFAVFALLSTHGNTDVDESGWIIGIGRISCYATAHLTVGPTGRVLNDGTIVFNATRPHKRHAQKFDKLYMPKGESFLLALQFYPYPDEPEFEAVKAQVIVDDNHQQLKAINNGDMEGFVLIGDKAFELWKEIQDGSKLSIKLELSNGSVHVVEMGKRDLDSVARMLEVCPS